MSNVKQNTCQPLGDAEWPLPRNPNQAPVVRCGSQAVRPLQGEGLKLASHPVRTFEPDTPPMHLITDGTLTAAPGDVVPLSTQATVFIDGIERGFSLDEAFVGLLSVSRRVPVRV